MPSVSVILPVLTHNERDRIMTECAVRIMRATTKIPFELVVVEAGGLRDWAREPGGYQCCPYNLDLAEPSAELLPDIYVGRDREGSSYTKDFNAGIDAASGDLLVHTANDLFTGEGWLEAMLEVFEKHPDAGCSTISILEPGCMIGPQRPEASICESFYGAIMMFRRGFRLDDENFPNEMSDYDLCMQIYAAGLRSYRNNGVVAHHLKGMTANFGLTVEAQKERFVRAAITFAEKWRGAPWLIQRVLIRGGVNYGHEHEPIYPGLEEALTKIQAEKAEREAGTD